MTGYSITVVHRLTILTIMFDGVEPETDHEGGQTIDIAYNEGQYQFLA
jgi:hypothetical protein